MLWALCAIEGERGFQGKVDDGLRWDAHLFGETQSRIVVSLRPEDIDQVEEIASKADVPFKRLGLVTGDRFIIRGLVDLSLEDLDHHWSNGLAKALE